MPYDNFPKDIPTSKIDSCVEQVMGQGHSKESAIRICYVSLVEGKELLEAMREYESKETTLSIFKEASGRYRWLVISSTSFQDRDKEIVSQAALEADTARMNETKEFGVLDWWHTPVTLGACDFSAMHGRSSVESGTFKDDFIGERLSGQVNELAVSRSFRHPIGEPDASGVYSHIETFARALLPRGRESNVLTQVGVVSQEKAMDLQKIKELITKLGGDKAAQDEVNTLLASAEQKEAAAEQAGITHKEETKPDAPATETPPAEPAKEKEPGRSWFLSDMKPEEFVALVTTGVKAALEPLAAEVKAMKEAQAATTKQQGEVVVKEITNVAAAQAAMAQRVAALEGNVPRAYRATQDPKTEVPKDKLKEAQPAADPETPFMFQFAARAAGMQPPPKP